MGNYVGCWLIRKEIHVKDVTLTEVSAKEERKQRSKSQEKAHFIWKFRREKR
jgi:hypothetical protein